MFVVCIAQITVESRSYDNKPAVPKNKGASILPKVGSAFTFRNEDGSVLQPGLYFITGHSEIGVFNGKPYQTVEGRGLATSLAGAEELWNKFQARLNGAK